MTSGSVFFRCDTLFPTGFCSAGKPSHPGWLDSLSNSSYDVDTRIRELGWHFMWLALYSTRIGVGRTAALAFDRAMHSALGSLNPRFNTAELTDVRLRKYPGFHVVRVMLASRHIQKWASLGLVDEAAFRIHPELAKAVAG